MLHIFDTFILTNKSSLYHYIYIVDNLKKLKHFKTYYLSVSHKNINRCLKSENKSLTLQSACINNINNKLPFYTVSS